MPVCLAIMIRPSQQNLFRPGYTSHRLIGLGILGGTVPTVRTSPPISSSSSSSGSSSSDNFVGDSVDTGVYAP